MAITTTERRRRIRKRLYKRQKGLCWICGERMSISLSAAGSSRYATFDHLEPKASGGSNAQTNLKLAHRKCNVMRGDLSTALVVLVQASATESI